MEKSNSLSVCINNLESDKNIGPVIFAKRLAKEMSSLGVNVVSRNDKYDIFLAIITDNNLSKAQNQGAKIIQRLDGVYYFSDQNSQAMNAPIINTFNQADAIIYQNNFSKKLVSRFIGKHDGLSKIICNGADPNIFNHKKKAPNKKPIFLASAKWRPTKRLKETVEGFVKSGINAELWVLGEPDYHLSNPNIHYFGEVNPSKLPDYYSKADALIHLCYNDNCPNSVVEALVSGLPVIATSSGGTTSLVKNSGIIIQDTLFKYEPIDSKTSPELNIEHVSKAIKNIYSKIKFGKLNIKRPDLHIKNVAKKYISFFNKVLGKTK